MSGLHAGRPALRARSIVPLLRAACNTVAMSNGALAYQGDPGRDGEHALAHEADSGSVDLTSRWAATSGALAAAVAERDAALRALSELRNEVSDALSAAQQLTDASLANERRRCAESYAALKAKYKKRLSALEQRCSAAERALADTTLQLTARSGEAAAALDRVAALHSALTAAEAATRSAVACAEAECAAKSEGMQRVLRESCAAKLRDLSVEVDAWRAFVIRVSGHAPSAARQQQHEAALRAAEERARVAVGEVALANASAEAARSRAHDAELAMTHMRDAVATLVRRCGVNPTELMSGDISPHALANTLNAALHAATAPLEARLAQADAEAVALRVASDSARAGQERSDARNALLAEQLASALDALRHDVAQLEAARQQESDAAQAALAAACMERDLAVQQAASLRRSLAEAAAGQRDASDSSPGASSALLERALQSLMVQ